MPVIHKVVSTVRYDSRDLEALRKIFDGSDFIWVDPRDEAALRREIQDADVAVLDADLNDAVLSGPHLRWIHCNHAGLNRSARPEVFERGILLSGSAGRSSPVLAEHCVYFMLAACYHTRELLAAQDACQWSVPGQNEWRGLFGRTAGILGMGHNGRMLADRLHAMGMRILTWDRSRVEGYDFARQLVSSEGDSPDELLAQSDFLCLNLALTDQTYHFFDRARFAKVKRGAVLVNMARGALVDTQALMEALDEGILSCAGLDVFEQEPLPPEHPLWKRRDVYITPHCTPQVPHRAGRCLEVIAENAARYRRGETLLNLVEARDLYTKS